MDILFEQLLSLSRLKTLTRLRKWNHEREIESLLIAAENNAIRPGYVKVLIDYTRQNRKYKLNGGRDETIHGIVTEGS